MLIIPDFGKKKGEKCSSSKGEILNGSFWKSVSVFTSKFKYNLNPLSDFLHTYFSDFGKMSKERKNRKFQIQFRDFSEKQYLQSTLKAINKIISQFFSTFFIGF